MTTRLQVEKVTCRPAWSTVLPIREESNSVKLPRECEEVRFVPTVSCLVAFGDSDVVATATSIRLVEKVPDKFGVPAGATHVAVVWNTENGKLYITQMGPS